MRLRLQGVFWVLGAAMAAGLAVAAWAWSSSAWQGHLHRAWAAGVLLHGAVTGSGAVPDGISLHPLPPDAPANRAGGVPDAVPGVFVTQLSLLDPVPGAPGRATVLVRLHSPDLQYPVAEVSAVSGPAAALGSVARLISSYCSDPEVFLRVEAGPWIRVEGAGVWGCAAQPRDLRLGAVIGLAAVLAVILSQVIEVSAAFGGFAAALAARRPGSAAFPLEGPEELRRTVSAVNDYLAEERDRLETRALVLSGVSHDLGTPATRLRLRAALIEDASLRARFNADIDAMTGMIESVLTYTRAEIGGEALRELSLTALVESVVADWQDIGRPVTLHPPESPSLVAGRSLFSAGGEARVTVDATRRILMQGRPMALQRALSNLIDNALKYGRRATVRLEARSDLAVIEVQDEGRALTPDDMAGLTAPFARGANAGLAPGVGLGLTIVATIAAQHGGALEFEQRPQGLCARLVLSRG